MTNPTPWKPPLVERIWLTTPIASPRILNIGPPELPWLMAASTRAVSESPRTTGAAPDGTDSVWISDTSALGSDAMTLALTTSPVTNRTDTSSATCTTCEAVMILPSAEIRNPDPRLPELTRLAGP